MIAMIDGDILAYHACHPRFAQINGSWQRIDTKDWPFYFSSFEDKQYLDKCWETYKNRVESIIEAVYATDFLMAVKSSVNYRDDIYPIQFGENGLPIEPRWGYKANRWKPTEGRNFAVKALRERAIENNLAIEAYGREADDLLRIWSTQCNTFNIPHIICTIDKDLKCLHGNYYHIKTGEKSRLTPFEADRFFYEQLLKGDGTDNIPGVPGIGEKRAANHVAKCSTEEELQELTVELYMNAYGTEWYSWLLSNAKMLYLQKHEHDYFRLSDWPIVKYLDSSDLDMVEVAPKKSRAKKAIVAKTVSTAAFSSPVSTTQNFLNNLNVPTKTPVVIVDSRDVVSVIPKDTKINPRDIKL